MATITKKDESSFLIAFDGLGLTDAQKKNIEEGIKALVLKEIATLNHGGDIKISKRFNGNTNWEELWKLGQLAGFWVEGFPDFPGDPFPDPTEPI